MPALEALVATYPATAFEALSPQELKRAKAALLALLAAFPPKSPAVFTS